MSAPAAAVGTDQHRSFRPAMKRKAHPDQVLAHDHFVVGTERQVPPPSRVLPLLGWRGSAQHARNRVVEGAQPGEEPDYGAV